MKLTFIFSLIFYCNFTYSEEYITSDWCNANYGNKSDTHLVKLSCEALVTAKKFAIPLDSFEKLDFSATHITNYSKFLIRAIIAQKNMSKKVGEKTLEVLAGYIDLIDYMSMTYGHISINVDSLELKKETMAKHYELSNLSTELKAL